MPLVWSVSYCRSLWPAVARRPRRNLAQGRVQTLTFRLANGSTRDLDMGWSDMELGGLEARPVYVVFGTDSDRVLLGAMALEAFALAADAKNRRLIPAELTL